MKTRWKCSTVTTCGVEVKICRRQCHGSRHVCRRLGLGNRTTSSPAIDRWLDDAALGHVAEDRALFARLSPGRRTAHHALRSWPRGRIHRRRDQRCALPACRGCGISVMGSADVARDAAQIIVGERSLPCCIAACGGPARVGHMMKYLLMGTSRTRNVSAWRRHRCFCRPADAADPDPSHNFLYDARNWRFDRRGGRELSATPQRGDMKVIRDFMLFIGRSARVRFRRFRALRVLHAGQAPSFRLVRRIPRHADVGAVRHPHDGQPVGAAGRALAIPR